MEKLKRFLKFDLDILDADIVFSLRRIDRWTYKLQNEKELNF